MTIAHRIRAHWALLLSVVLVGGSLVIVSLTGPDSGDVDTTPGQFAGVRSLDDDLMKRADTASLRFPDGILFRVVGRAGRPDRRRLRSDEGGLPRAGRRHRGVRTGRS